jgi:hypothetical protein
LDKTFITALTGEGKTSQPPFGRGKCTPSAAFGGTSPGGGGLLSAYPCANLSCSLYSGEKTSPSGGSPRRGIGVHFCCGDPAEGLQVGRSLSLACTQKDLPMNRPTDEARFYGFRCQRQRCRQRRHIYSSPKAIPHPLNLLNPLNPLNPLYFPIVI